MKGQRVSDGIMIMMISVSTLLGAVALGGLIWAVKTGQFDDHKKFVDAIKHDSSEDLRDAAMMEAKKRELKSKRSKKIFPVD